MDEPVVDFGHRQTQAPSTAPPPAALPISATFRAKAEQWKRQLLDVSKRNRAINFRPGRGTLTLPLTPSELWDALGGDEGKVSFDARDFAPDAARPDEDDRVKDAFAAAARLLERARLADREQGVQVLFIAVGWLNWIDADGRTPLRSPLGLIPVHLEINRQERSLVLGAASEDEPEVNPSLAYLLQVQAGVKLPRFSDDQGEPTYASFFEFIEALKPLVAKQPGWSVEEGEALLDVFAFAKLAMVDEIERSMDRLAAHPLLSALAGDVPLPPAEPAAPVETLDSRYEPGKLHVIVEADAYQMQAVAMAAAGQSFVIEGPPGTGKSQTITNIIAELLAHQKTVLFVAEKRVAREVVLENLTKAGLAEACLHLAVNAGAGSKADAKAAVINDITTTLDGPPAPPAPDAELPGRVADLRGRLSGYPAAIGAPIGAGGWTNAYEVFGNAERLRGERRGVLGVPPIESLSRFQVDDLLDEAGALDGFRADDLALMAREWRGFKLTSVAPEQRTELAAALATLSQLPPRLTSSAAGTLGPAHGDASGMTLNAVAALSEKLSAVAEFQKRSGSFLRFVTPAFYRAKSGRATYLAEGYVEPPDPAAHANAMSEVGDAARGAIATLETAFATVPAGGSVAELAAWATTVQSRFDALAVAAEIAAALARVEPLGARTAFEQLLTDAGAYGHFAQTLRASLYGEWADRLAAGPLSATPDQHHRALQAYERSDSELIGRARSVTLRVMHGNRPAPRDPRLAPLLKYARAKRRPSLRMMLGNSREAVQLLKPCLLMSPLGAAQYLCQGGDHTYRFDACIVDEASMIPTPDLVVAMSLAKQAVIVGDSKQMPPTSFFQKEIDPINGGDTEDDVTFESVLDELAPTLPSTMLRAHYRSRDDALIAFSNVQFYGGRLIAFPDAWSERPETGVRFEYVKDAIYGRGASRANPAEAKRAIDLLRTELVAGEGKKQVSITAMSLAQQAEILEQIDSAAMLDPLLRGWIEGGGQVRNLETVQGDECDVMILSIGYGKDADGKLTMNFGPLGQEKGERRLNVAVTRARWKTIVVSSLRAGDIDPGRTSSTGALALRSYLDYAERGPVAIEALLPTASTAEAAVFEQVVLEALVTRGLHCVPKVGVGGYRVDIGIAHPEDAGRFVLGVECDGPTYYGAPAVRDRELGRRKALERMGWQLHRTWSAAWHRDPEAEAGRIIERYEALIAPKA